MTKFATDNKCSLKGIIDYEIAKKRGKREFYIPVFYSSPTRFFASGDSVLKSDYLQGAKEAKTLTISYMIMDDNWPRPLDGVKVKTDLLDFRFTFKTHNWFFNTKAFKINY